MELNASDERGINVVRNRIKSFASKMIATNNSHNSVMFSCKILILDEVDNMTLDAQNALRRIIEIYSESTRFFLICNHISSITEPLISRFAVMRFKQLTADETNSSLTHIIKNERIQITDDVIKKICETSSGDLRKAVILLQSAVRIYGNTITVHSIVELSGSIPRGLMICLWDSCLKDKIDSICSNIKNILAGGFSADQILANLLEKCLAEQTIDEEQRAKILIQLASTDKSILDGADEFFQIANVTATIQRIISTNELDDD
eukprot:gnl/MRDRNA2_/MRDRNA2_60107_c0_seq2.p1 gnl/MRDRNA2_/MRDRNA2_60107_c0~~gnl/MRDRNA2_/MRDRNA2_60107_c0_seq2.p1  ORF type:complete len:263 (+),score=-7.91 gnl/MRDRNA2_/MRDRNA2_60107_c0_seq2:320-1108(+)